jgi:ABC-type multidrug transport system fused ATPase/permease subunit
MEGGVIKETGTHRELLAKSTYYRKLCDLQFHRHGESDAPLATAPL